MRPGSSRLFFDFSKKIPLNPDLDGFSVVNALWLAEISRLVYLQGFEEIGDKFLGLERRDVLEHIDLHETHFFDKAGTQCAVIVSTSSSARPFGVVVFRGSHDLLDWRQNIRTKPASWDRGGVVHCGYRTSLMYVWDELEKALQRLNIPFFYTGHSLGAALATLAAGLIRPVAVYSFGSPRLGDSDFAKTLEGVPTFRIVNNRDVVTSIPPTIWPLSLAPVGEHWQIGPDSSIRSHPAKDQAARARYPLDKRRWFDPPRLLADHAPGNYVAHLERAAANLYPAV